MSPVPPVPYLYDMCECKGTRTQKIKLENRRTQFYGYVSGLSALSSSYSERLHSTNTAFIKRTEHAILQFAHCSGATVALRELMVLP